MYDEALTAFKMLQEYAFDTLQSCNNSNDFSAVRGNFVVADEHYKTASGIVAHLALWHASRVSEKKFTDWTWEERKQDAQIRSLAGMISSHMNHLLTVYGIWLRKAQLNAEVDV
jgi:hypothetical protein